MKRTSHRHAEKAKKTKAERRLWFHTSDGYRWFDPETATLVDEPPTRDKSESWRRVYYTSKHLLLCICYKAQRDSFTRREEPEIIFVSEISELKINEVMDVNKVPQGYWTARKG